MKKLSLVLAVAMAFSVWAGCGPDGGDGPVEIVVVSPFDDKDGNRQNFVNAYRAFEEATGYVVIDESTSSSEEWRAQIMTDFESGNEPDVIFYFTGPDADTLVQNGKVVSISDIRREFPDYADNMKDSMMPVSTASGRQYAVPVNGYWEGLFVNKKVLEACGVAIPGADYTWEQFLEDCRIIKEHGYVPIAASLMEIPHYWFEFTIFNNGSVANHLRIPASSQDETGEIWSAGLRDIKELFELGFFPENTNTAVDAELNFLMTEHKAAFMIDGSWKIGWFQAHAEDIGDFAVTYVPAKGERKPTDIVGGLSMGYYITKKAWDDPRKREACVAFVKAMTTDEVVNSFGALSVTALKNGTTPPENADALEMSANDMTTGCTSVVAAAQDLLAPSMRGMLFGDIPGIVTGVITPEEAIDKMLSSG